jgi:low temperature requirement protein LtrA
MSTREPESSRHLRTGRLDEKQETTALELFFDLVFVFAVTQLSHLLLDHLTWEGAAQTFFLLLVVWWAWTYTTWWTNWFDPESSIPVRLVLIGAMLASLLMSVSIPEAFGDRGLLFAGAYVTLQVGRSGWAVWAYAPGSAGRRIFKGITAWAVAAGILWLAGGLVDTPGRTVIWLAALLVDYMAPSIRYWTPWWGRAGADDWPINPSHFAERFQLFIIIALGESIVVSGATASGLDLDDETIIALSVAFIGTAALWWLYFDFVARIATHRLQISENPGNMARDGYTYLHLPIVAGIIVAAVGDELVVAHPGQHLEAVPALVVVAGPAIYLVGHVFFRLRMAGSISQRRLFAALAIMLLWFVHAAVTALVLAALVVVVLLVVIAIDARSTHGAAALRASREAARANPNG